MNLQTLKDSPRAVLSDDRVVVFGFTKAELLFGGLMLGGMATGCAGLDHWEDLTHPKIIMAILMQLGGAAVGFASGRFSKGDA